MKQFINFIYEGVRFVPLLSFVVGSSTGLAKRAVDVVGGFLDDDLEFEMFGSLDREGVCVVCSGGGERGGGGERKGRERKGRERKGRERSGRERGERGILKLLWR